MGFELGFLGAAGTVTGSRFLLKANSTRILVDCGLFQGSRKIKALNWDPFPVPVDQIDAIVITHAHIDHSGYLPRLIKDGFQGPIYASEATCALLKILLPDSAYLQEQDAAYANKRGYSRHKPALPLYLRSDADQTLGLLKAVPFHKMLKINGASVTWRPAGHILGSAILELDLDGQHLVFSGDLGRFESEIMKAPTKINQADVLFVESTYGNRLHSDDSMQEILTQVVTYIFDRKGVLLIPAFAVGRTQQVLYHLRKLQDQGAIPDLPVYIDSPMAVEASHIYCRYGEDHNLDIDLLMDDQQCPLRCRDTHFVQSVEESKALNVMPGPAVIISASGMLSGGRIMHHLKWRLPEAKNAVLFVGYQPKGARGRLLLEGADQLKIHGKSIPVKARMFQINALSAHADRDELLQWLSAFKQPPQKTFVVHGEPESQSSLQNLIKQEFGWDAIVPSYGDQVQISNG